MYDMAQTTSTAVVPQKFIYSEADLARFQQSQAHAELVAFVRLCNDAVIGKPISQTSTDSFPVLQRLVDMLNELHSWVDDVPPAQQPMRFGNTAFRTWHARLTERSEELVQRVLGEEHLDYVKELAPYLLGSFGHEVRIDYGTGHETCFVVFLFCLYKLRVITVDALPALILRVFTSYLRTMRHLQEVYMLEPAGSHGVWGLDDYHCLVFLWGSSQLRDHPSISPQSIHDDAVLAANGDEYMYLDAIRFIKKIKAGAPFAESSPMLNDISALPEWKKVNSGMLKLYQAEVLGKRPVVQHMLFGSLFPADWTPSKPADSDSGAAETESHLPDVYTRMPDHPAATMHPGAQFPKRS